ncbi:hypothetical protein PM082_020174 [Marasmius tenuissimus]|nr:hypothetical protein PM082_020174 [Marasmius tenuissimus]
MASVQAHRASPSHPNGNMASSANTAADPPNSMGTPSMQTTSGEVDMQYQLPPLLESLKTSWDIALQSSAMVTALLASLSATLLQTYRSDPSFGPIFGENVVGFNATERRLAVALHSFSYGSLLLNASATFTSLMLIDKLGGMSRRSASTDLSNRVDQGNLVAKTDFEIFAARIGNRGYFRYSYWHWRASLFGGIFCLVLQIVLYAILKGRINESMFPWIFAIVLAAWVLLPVGAVALKDPNQ